MSKIKRKFSEIDPVTIKNVITGGFTQSRNVIFFLKNVFDWSNVGKRLLPVYKDRFFQKHFGKGNYYNWKKFNFKHHKVSMMVDGWDLIIDCEFPTMLKSKWVTIPSSHYYDISQDNFVMKDYGEFLICIGDESKIPTRDDMIDVSLSLERTDAECKIYVLIEPHINKHFLKVLEKVNKLIKECNIRGTDKVVILTTHYNGIGNILKEKIDKIFDMHGIKLTLIKY